jgi:hypothetical protein
MEGTSGLPSRSLGVPPNSTLDGLFRDAPTHVQAEVYFVQRKLAEMIVPDEMLGTICGLPSYKSNLNGGQKPCLKIEELIMGRVPFQNTQTTAEGSSDTSAPITAARTAAASNLEDQDVVTGDASDVGEQGTK